MKATDGVSGVGRSLLEMMLEELDESYLKLKALTGRSLLDGTHQKLQGECLGLAKAIAIILTPYKPNVDSVRKIAEERYNADHK